MSLRSLLATCSRTGIPLGGEQLAATTRDLRWWQSTCLVSRKTGVLLIHHCIFESWLSFSIPPTRATNIFVSIFLPRSRAVYLFSGQPPSFVRGQNETTAARGIIQSSELDMVGHLSFFIFIE